MIRELEWDSGFFEKKIGRVDVSKDFNIIAFQKEAKSFDLVYVFSEKPINNMAELVDVKVTYAKNVQHYGLDQNIEDYNKNKHNYNQLLELAYLSGHESRFKKDSFFCQQAFKGLYKKWLDKNINEPEQRVLVFVENQNLAGFVSYESTSSEALIHLIAVDSGYQGRGIGRKLMQAVENKLTLPATLSVPTQKTNEIAVRFYENYGFRLKQTVYIYHYKK